MSDEPIIAQKAPFEQTLEPGKYAWCACGRSATEPFCDGSHKGTDLNPVIFEIAETQTVWLCGCKHTKNQPFCDGTHNEL